MLAVIGPAWTTASTPAGLRRLDLPDDYVRREVGAALAGDARVIPVLVGGAAMPGQAGRSSRLVPDIPGADVPRSNNVGPLRFEVEKASYTAEAAGSWLVLLQIVMTNEHPSEQSSNAHYRYVSLDVDGHPAEVFCYTDINPLDGQVGPDEKATAIVGFKVTRDPHGHLQLRLEHQPDPVSLDLTPA